MSHSFHTILTETLQSSRQKAEKQAQAAHRAVYEFVDDFPRARTQGPDGKTPRRSEEATFVGAPPVPVHDNWMSTEAYVALYHLEVDAPPPLCLLPDHRPSLSVACLSPREVFARLA